MLNLKAPRLGLPWQRGRDGAELRCRDGKPLATFWLPADRRMGEGEANAAAAERAELALMAANSHEPLIAALEDVARLAACGDAVGAATRAQRALTEYRELGRAG